MIHSCIHTRISNHTLTFDVSHCVLPAHEYPQLTSPLIFITCQVIRVPYLDREVQGIYGLQYLGKSLVEA